MPRPWIACLTAPCLASLLALGAAALAQTAQIAQTAQSAGSAGPAGSGTGLGIKPGLWDVNLVKQVVDGRDISAQVAASLSQAQQMLANLPPVQRARLEAMLNQAGVTQGSNGSFRICVSPEMAQRDLPFLDRQGRCRPVMLSRAGNQVSFRFQCTANGTTMNGRGRATVTGELVSTHTDVTASAANGATHVIQNETQMHYISADCGALKPPA